MQKGEIFFHKNLLFKNGETGEKYLVLMNTPTKQDKYVFCKTTTQQKTKSKNPGCNPGELVFFIPAQKDWFPKDTWIQLHEYYQFHAVEAIQDYWDHNLLEKGVLQDLTIRQLVNCVKRLEDVEEESLELILKK